MKPNPDRQQIHSQTTLTHTTTNELTPSQQLGELPLTRKHVRLLGTTGIGWALDAMDVGLISFIMAALVAHWQLSPSEVGWLGSIGFLGMALGATFGGLLADKFGRRQIFALTLLIYGLATGASALATGLGMLMVFRFIVGLGLGAELPVASTYIAEFSPRAIRGRMVVLLEAFWAVGWIAAACIGTFVVGSGEHGWRWALALGCIPAIYALVVRWGMPESVRFLELTGKQHEAQTIVDSFASSPAVGAGQEAASTSTEATSHTQTPATPQLPENAGWRTLWSQPLRRTTALLWTVWFSINLAYYGAFIWIPTILHSAGFSLVKSFSFTLVITLAQLPGYAVAAYLIERWGRRNTLAAFLAGSAGSALCFGLATTEWQIIAAGCCLSFFNLGAWGALYAIGPELYPTAVRTTGTGAAAGFGRIASILAPLLVPFVLAHFNAAVLFGLFGVAFAVAAGAAYFLPEQRGQALS